MRYINVLLSLAAVAVAEHCVPGGTYCGWTLRNYDEGPKMTSALSKAGQPVNTDAITHGLFACRAADTIDWLSYCPNGCEDFSRPDEQAFCTA